MARKILVTSALPYSNGPIHIGHLAGAYLPADIFVRYQRLAGNDVLFICGADEHGVPITIAARKQGITPKELVDKYYELNRDSFADLGILFDNYSRTSLPVHYTTSQEFFLTMYNKGKLKEKTSKQLYDPENNMFLADRYVRGTCPKCGSPDARGDQCEKCGSWLDPLSLKDPRSVLTGATPVVKTTRHWYLPMADFQASLEEWLGSKKGWKDNVMNYCNGWFKEGLKDRAITRDLEWGVPVPLEGAEGKVMYVWFDAPIGYISSTKEWAQNIGDPDRWKKYWCNEDCELIHFIGKDNIVFHAIFWPAVLMEVGGYNLPTQIPANEFLNLEGRKLSTSQDYAVWLPDYLEKFPPDLLRYTLAANLPEAKDADFSWKLFQKCNNDELADIFGNFVNRTLTFVQKYCDGRIPASTSLQSIDSNVLDEVALGIEEVGNLINEFKIRTAIARAMEIARAGNRYFDASEPWKARKEDFDRCKTILHVCCHIIRSLAVCFYPFLPFTAERLWAMMGFEEPLDQVTWLDATKHVDIENCKLGDVAILFKKLEDSDIQPEVDRLQHIIERMEAKENNREKTAAPETGVVTVSQISFDEFAQVSLRVAEIVSAEPVQKTDKLLKLKVSLGDEERQIVAGIAQQYAPDELTGKKILIVANLKPAKLRGIESQGMLLAAEDGNTLSLVTVDRDVPAGSAIR
jgi:methionyl-tRNA synthetase